MSIEIQPSIFSQRRHGRFLWAILLALCLGWLLDHCRMQSEYDSYESKLKSLEDQIEGLMPALTAIHDRERDRFKRGLEHVRHPERHFHDPTENSF